MIADFLRFISRVLIFKGGPKLLGRFLVLQTHDYPKKKYQEQKRRKLLMYQNGIVCHLLFYSYHIKKNDKIKQMKVEEAHTIQLDNGIQQTINDIQTVISEDLQSQRDNDFEFIYLDKSIIAQSV